MVNVDVGLKHACRSNIISCPLSPVFLKYVWRSEQNIGYFRGGLYLVLMPSHKVVCQREFYSEYCCIDHISYFDYVTKIGRNMV